MIENAQEDNIRWWDTGDKMMSGGYQDIKKLFKFVDNMAQHYLLMHKAWKPASTSIVRRMCILPDLKWMNYADWKQHKRDTDNVRTMTCH